MKILMIGATGEFAGLVLPELKRRGAIVRALIHNPKSEKPARDRGADEIAMGDLADTRSLIAAAQGVDSVFHINPAFVPDEARLGTNMVDAAVAAGAKKIVFSGVLHPSYLELSNHAAKLPVEQAIYTSGLAYTVLQPTIFMQGTVPPAAWPQIVQHRQFAMPYSKEKKAAYVDYRDVAEAAALALTSDRLDYGTFELCAPGMLTRTEIAALMTEAAGVPIQAVDVPFDHWVQLAQIPEGPLRDVLRPLFAEFDAHGLSGGNGLVLRAILGREPRSFRQFLGDLATQKQAKSA